MKKYAILMILFFVSIWVTTAQAEAGTIEIQFQKEAIEEDTKILYTKVATMKNGLWNLEKEYLESNVNLNALETAIQTEKATKELLECVDTSNLQEVTEKNKIVLQDLEPGLYLITFSKGESKEIKPTLVAIPGWTGKEMTYHVKVIPKFQEKISAPKTGSYNSEIIYMGLMAISCIIIAGLSCHKRFKCGKISSII